MKTLTRDDKINLAFVGFQTATTALLLMNPITSPLLLGARLVGSAAGNLLGAEAVKTVANWLDSKTGLTQAQAAATH